LLKAENGVVERRLIAGKFLAFLIWLANLATEHMKEVARHTLSLVGVKHMGFGLGAAGRQALYNIPSLTRRVGTVMGQLVTSDGHAVMGESGPIAFSPQESAIEIGADGTVSSTQGQRGKLRLVRFADSQALRSEGSNVFSSTAPAQAAGTAAQVQSGSLERSNVKPVVEMSRLIDVNRSYTSISSMLTRMDELRRTAISRLADQNA
jgi:hypothetical protein